jgi:serine/threonine-protein kinase
MTVPVLPGNHSVGQRINNRYEIRGYLGGGANGEVYEVFDHHQEHLCALKLFQQTTVTGAWHEAAVLTGLDGEFVLPILNADLAAGVPFIVTEILTNKGIDSRIVPDIGVDVEPAARWTQQACRGVARIHDKNLLHNDIKPANLFLDANDNVMVGDLGFSCFRDPTGHGNVNGTPATVAPEVARVVVTVPPGQHGLHRATSIVSDVYSLGSSLYWMLAGHQVHLPRNLSKAEYLTVVATEKPTPIRDVAPHVPYGLAQIVMKAIAMDPADRFQFPAALDAAIGARTKPVRQWTRVPPCPGHTMCFLGSRPAHAELAVCTVPTGRRTEHTIEVHRGTARHRKFPWPQVARQALLAGALRATFRRLD